VRFLLRKMRARKGTSRLTQRYLASTDMEGLIMTDRRGQKTTAMREVLASNDVRTLIANQLGVDVKRVTDEAHFANDLRADWLDRLELMIVIEDRFADVIITDEDVGQIEVVGDLIRHIENVDNGGRGRRIVGRAAG
jgi:acyl carrier protein